MEERIGFGRRLAAFAIDWAVIAIIGCIIGIIIGGILGVSTREMVEPGMAQAEAEVAQTSEGVLGSLMIRIFLGVCLVNILWLVWEGFTGAALGKLILKIQIKDTQANSAGTARLLFRAIVKYASYWLALIAIFTGIESWSVASNLVGQVVFIGCFFVLLQAKQTLHDKITGTAVFLK